ncbi:heparinase II/III family protein [uncultured Sphingomonas sp.]|uniref:heparinase II/III family protein n=1 Tax=uncultured Sphingomonas sp. TaxID=158754 RepID=UPI0035C9BFF0
MNEADETDTIDEGKRLIRQGGDRGLSLSDRVAERFRRLTWRTPIHALRLRGRHPLKLIAVPDDPVPGDRRRGQALLEGRVDLRGESVDLETLDFTRPTWSRPMGDHLQSFAWLRDLAAACNRARGAPVAEYIMRHWLAAHAETISEPAWRAELWGRRILHWTAHAPLILSSADLIYRSSVLNALARGARHVERGAEKAPAGVARIAAWCGVIAAGLLIPGGDSRRAAGEAGLGRAIDSGVYEDGGVIARAPLAQVEVIQLLTMLRDVYAARRLGPPAAAAAALGRMVPALQGICHGDHGLSSWQGGGPISGTKIDAIVAATGVRARPLRQSRDWGYQRLSFGQVVVVVDAAPPPMSRLAEGGCASTLAFEMSDGAERLIVNCGGARASIVQVPPALADGLRTTAAHSTLIVGDSNSTAIHADGTLGRGVAEVELARQESAAAARIEASHDGYARRFGFLHRRQLVLAGDGRELRGDDMLLPAGRRRRGGRTPFVIRFHLGSGVGAAPTADGMAALLRLASGRLWQFRCRGGALTIEESLWVDLDGRPVPTQQLVIAAEAPAGGESIGWSLKRIA